MLKNSTNQHNILLMCNSDFTGDPRPIRMVSHLKENNKLTVLSKYIGQYNNVEIISINYAKKKIANKIVRAMQLKLNLFEQYLWDETFTQLANKLSQRDYDLIITHDLILLPLALKIKKKARVLFDAREYYPRHFEDQFMFRFFSKQLNEYLCAGYMTECDYVITVSEGIAKEYRNQYGINADVVMSLPTFTQLSPTPVNNKHIRIIHHGGVTPSRKIEKMIEMIDYLDDKYTMDMMLVGMNGNSYAKKIIKMINKRQRIKLINPVPFENLIKFSNQYDIGLFLVQPSTFNLEYTLPNKLFEFIQSRLAVAIGPSKEMAKIVTKYDCGLVSDDFEPKTLSFLINNLNAEKIMYYKNQADHAAHLLNSDKSNKQIDKIINKIIIT